MKQSSALLVGELGGRSITFPTDTFDRTFAESFAGVLGDKRSVVAACSTTAGSAFEVASGKVRFRFCSCFWCDHAEAWGLK